MPAHTKTRIGHATVALENRKKMMPNARNRKTESSKQGLVQIYFCVCIKKKKGKKVHNVLKINCAIMAIFRRSIQNEMASLVPVARRGRPRPVSAGRHQRGATTLSVRSSVRHNAPHRPPAARRVRPTGSRHCPPCASVLEENGKHAIVIRTYAYRGRGRLGNQNQCV